MGKNMFQTTNNIGFVLGLWCWICILMCICRTLMANDSKKNLELKEKISMHIISRSQIWSVKTSENCRVSAFTASKPSANTAAEEIDLLELHEVNVMFLYSKPFTAVTRSWSIGIHSNRPLIATHSNALPYFGWLMLALYPRMLTFHTIQSCRIQDISKIFN